MGKYYTALWLSTLLAMLTELGLHTVLIREMASDRPKSTQMITNALAIRLVVSIIAYIPTVILARIVYPDEIALLIYIVCISGLMNALAQLLRCVFRAFERMDIEAAGVVLERCVLFVFGLWAVIRGHGITGFCIVVLIASVVNLVMTLVILLWKFSRPSLKLLDIKLCVDLLKQSLPFALSGALSALYFRLDGLILKHLMGANGDIAIGWYGTGYNFIISLTIIPGAFMGAIFPVMSRMINSSDSAMDFLYTKSFKLIFILAIPIAVGLTFLADGIVLLLYPIGENINLQDQAALSRVLEILSWVSALAFLNFVFITIFRAANRRRAFLIVMILSVVVNVASNLVLIPLYGHLGAAISMIVSESAIFISGLWYTQRHVCKLNEFGFIVKVVFASCLLGTGLFIWKYTLWGGAGKPVLLTICVAIVGYFAAILALRGITVEDIGMLRGNFAASE